MDPIWLFILCFTGSTYRVPVAVLSGNPTYQARRGEL
jgi:hypothetical protein